MGIPAAAVEAGARQTTWAMAAGVLIAGALASGAALIVGRRIAAPIVHLAAAANAVGRGERSASSSPTRVAELADLSRALDDAAAAVRAREEAQGQLAAIVQSSTDAIIGYTLDGVITSWNPAAARMLGYSAAEAIGQSIDLIVPPERRDEEAEVRRRLRNGATLVPFETIRLRKDGQPVDVSLTVSPIHDAAGNIVGASKISRDVSDRKRVEAERAALLASEQAARAEAEDANRAKDQFLAILSHELRTPLSAVYGWARMLQAGQLREGAAQRALDSIVRNASAQVQLIDDLLDVSRVITGKMRLDVQAVDLGAVVTAALEAVRPAAAAKQVRLREVIDPRAGPISGDPVRLQQVVWNLLMNAVKFTPRGGQVQVHVQRVNSHVEIVVSDTGQGIAPEVLPFVFDRFRQADSSSTRAHSGLGLGLALVRHLSELHGGSVVAQSPGEGKGATFIVKLPVMLAGVPAGSPPRVHPTAAGPESLPEGARLDGLRVLVVDDDPDALELATAILTSAGAVVRTCAAAAPALEIVRSWRPAVLVSDLEMPGEDGLSLMRRVRALGADEGGMTPAVALTAYGRTQDRMRSLAAGYSMHISKPVDPAELTTIIANVAARPPRPDTL
jgi:PAS domain S-box-containing protein